MKIIHNDNGIWTIESETRSIDLTANEVSLLVNQFMKHGLRESIEYRLNERNGDDINLEAYPYSYDELVDEIFTDLEEKIDYGEYPDDEDIDSGIDSVAQFYEMELE